MNRERINLFRELRQINRQLGFGVESKLSAEEEKLMNEIEEEFDDNSIKIYVSANLKLVRDGLRTSFIFPSNLHRNLNDEKLKKCAEDLAPLYGVKAVRLKTFLENEELKMYDEYEVVMVALEDNFDDSKNFWENLFDHDTGVTENKEKDMGRQLGFPENCSPDSIFSGKIIHKETGLVIAGFDCTDPQSITGKLKQFIDVLGIEEFVAIIDTRSRSDFYFRLVRIGVTQEQKFNVFVQDHRLK